MDWLGTTCRRMLHFLEQPDPQRARHLRHAIGALDAACRKSGITHPLPITLRTITRATSEETVHTAVEALRPEVERLHRLRIRS